MIEDKLSQHMFMCIFIAHPGLWLMMSRVREVTVTMSPANGIAGKSVELHRILTLRLTTAV